MKRSGAGSFQDFYRLLQTVHQIPRVDVLLGYTDVHGDLLPINNDDNYHKALSSANPLLRVIIQKKGKQELEKGTGSEGHRIRRRAPDPSSPSREMSHVPWYHWFHVWAVAACHVPASHHHGGWIRRRQHWEAPRDLPGLWHPHRLSPAALPRGKGTHASPAPRAPASKGKSSQFTPLKSRFPAGLACAPGKHRVGPVSAALGAPSAPCPEVAAAIVLAELSGCRVLPSFWQWEEARLLPGSPGARPARSGTFPESNFLTQEREIAVIAASQ